MKHIWPILIFFLTACNVHAQFALKAGGTASTYHGFDSKIQFLNGKIFGISYTYQFNRRLSLTFESMYAEKGTKMTFHKLNIQDNVTWYTWVDYRQRITYLDLPLYVNFAFVNQELIKFKVGMGGYVDILLGAHKSPRPYPDNISVRRFDRSQSNDFDFQKVMRGLLLLAEIDMKAGSNRYALFQFRYYYGTSRLNKPIYDYYQLPGHLGRTDLYKYYDSTISVLLGITI